MDRKSAQIVVSLTWSDLREPTCMINILTVALTDGTLSSFTAGPSAPPGVTETLHMQCNQEPRDDWL